MRRRVAITGIGLVTPVGVGVEETWAALVGGCSGAGPITQFDPEGLATRIACEVDGFDPARWIEKRLAKTVDRFIQFGAAAAMMARDDAGLEISEAEAERVGVYVGSGMGGIITIQDTRDRMVARGARRGVSPYLIPSIIPNLAGGQISILLGARGPNMAHVSACSSGAHAIGEA